MIEDFINFSALTYINFIFKGKKQRCRKNGT